MFFLKEYTLCVTIVMGGSGFLLEYRGKEQTYDHTGSINSVITDCSSDRACLQDM